MTIRVGLLGCSIDRRFLAAIEDEFFRARIDTGLLVIATHTFTPSMLYLTFDDGVALPLGVEVQANRLAAEDLARTTAQDFLLQWFARKQT